MLPEFRLARWRKLAATALLGALFFGNAGFRSLVGNWLELRRLRGEIASMQKEQERVEERLKAVRGGKAPLERIVRRELGYLKPGEIEYRFDPPGQKKD